MNPNTTIRPWILAAGKQFGLRYAEDYRWPDADDRQEEIYVNYRIARSIPGQVGVTDATTATSYTAHHTGIQKWVHTVEIDLFDSQDGISELAAFAVAAQHNQSIKDLFKAKGVAFRNAEVAEDLSRFDGERIDYHHRLTCFFIENISITLDETNAVVDDVDIDDAIVVNDLEGNPI